MSAFFLYVAGRVARFLQCGLAHEQVYPEWRHFTLISALSIAILYPSRYLVPVSSMATASNPLFCKSD
jgi:hypothetical protein